MATKQIDINDTKFGKQELTSTFRGETFYNTHKNQPFLSS